ncbi:MAG: 5-(carboxyamino)imidazole ribonucleotide mutase [Bacteroidetes bacterium]|nr:MAG: 5-(carboxyamino)imidazole ribonucleotide mutase [Bacteroidota bacterium]
MDNQIRIGIAMGSESDWPTMEAAAVLLKELNIRFEARVLSAHRTPDAMTKYAKEASALGIKVIIAGAGGAAHLPGMIAASTILPVIGVPIETRTLKGMDSLLSIVQMPSGVPVATVAIGGARNAGILAAQILATSDASVGANLEKLKTSLIETVERMDDNVSEKARTI